MAPASTPAPPPMAALVAASATRRRRRLRPRRAPPHEFERAFAPKLPATLGGAAFLAAHPGGHGDGATEVAADRTYPVLPAAHAVPEGHRARLARELLSGGAARGGAGEALGELMLQSQRARALRFGGRRPTASSPSPRSSASPAPR